MKLIMPEIGNEELELIKEALASNILTNDVKVHVFEQKVAEYVGVSHAVAVSTGTAALHLALIAAGINEGDEVILPAMAFPATVNAVLYLRAVPVLVDININTLNIEPREIESKITSKTKAILPVDLFGLSVDIAKLKEIALKHNLKLIEDASYAFGSQYQSHYCGSLADVAAYSFNERRVITCAEGGMVVTNDDEIAEKVKLLRNHAMLSKGKNKEATFVDIGYNYRLSEIHAAIGLAQLDKIENILAKRRSIGKEYTKIIEDIPNVTPAREPLGYVHNFSNYVIKLDVNMNTAAIKSRLEEREIPTTVGTYCLHKNPIYNFKGKYPVAEYAYQYGISLPITSKMNYDDVYYICEMLERLVV